MPRRKTLYRAALLEAGEFMRGLDRPLDLPEGVPATLEVGMGAGHVLTARAALEPGRWFVGIEIKEERTYQAVREARRLGLTNIRFLVGELTRLDPALPRGRFDEILILFPDPWPRKSDAKRRMVDIRYLGLYAPWLRPKARGLFRTDNPDLFEFALESFPAAGYRVISAERGVGPREFETRYEKRFRAEGTPINEITFEGPDA